MGVDHSEFTSETTTTKMASTLSTVFQGAEDKAPFLIVPRVSTKDYEKVKLTRSLDANTKRTTEVPKLTIADAELACHVCLAFNRASRPSCLNLNTPHLMFEEFSKCLSLDYQELFDELREQEFVVNENQETLAGFRSAQRRLVLEIAGDAAVANQEEYFKLYQKSRTMDCKVLAERLKSLNRLTTVFNQGGHRQWTEQQLKNFYFNMMPIPWRLSLDMSGDQLMSNENFTLKKLAEVMQFKWHALRARLSLERKRQRYDEERPRQRRRLSNGNRVGSGGRKWNNNSHSNNYSNNNNSWSSNNNRNGRSNGQINRFSNGRGQGFGNGGSSGNNFNNQGGRPNFNRNGGQGYNGNNNRGYNSGRNFGGTRGNGSNGGNNQQQGRQDNFQVDHEQNQDVDFDDNQDFDPQQEYDDEFQDDHQAEDDYLEEEEDHYLTDFGLGDNI